ncbi:NAD(P)H-dependent oxidoreductase [Opitutus sp. ER46]|uniref:FMN-dependent NADH-azoreductase n=1 Tax=Opitutus sp. ER46 TaxID=2161864 RepID=UPI000D31258B|nr:NAD(P)H-dependent oxidoreductase [Opitutus sp. ER46]PTX94508.1 FMN-dependent NADH-azoreductase [Opitutus sp. ER46]
MNNLLVIHSSGRVTRSITRRLTTRLVAAWKTHHPDGQVVERDLTQSPPPVVNEPWIAAAFADPKRRTPAMLDALASSDALIAEIERADAIVIGAPVYNFGLPAQLKAYIDQIVRVGRTFGFNAEAAQPYTPLLQSKPVVVLTSAGDGSLLPGGALAHLNFLEPHLTTVFGFIGLTDVTFVRVGHEEYQDERLAHSLAAAETAVEELAARGAPAAVAA